MTKKGLALLLTIAMLLTSLVGMTSALAADGVTKLVVSMMTWTGAPADTQAIQDAINAITVPELGIEVELQISDAATYSQNIRLALSGGEQIDIFTTIMAGYPTLSAQGYLIDLEENDLLQNFGAGIIEAVGMEFIDACRVGGVLYGLPNNRDMAQGRGCAAIGTEYLEGIGYEIPADQANNEIVKITLDELNEIYGKLHEQYPELEVYRPVALSMSQFSNVDSLGGSVFGVLTNYGAGLTVENLFESDYYRTYCERMYDYNQKGYISPDAATDTTAVTELVKAGTLMSYTTGGKPGIKMQETSLCGRPMTIFQTMDDYIASSAIASFPWAISLNTIDAEKTMTLMNAFFTNADLANILAWGIEGKHYQILENGLADFPEGVNASSSGWNHSMGWLLPNQFLTHVWNGNDPKLWDNIRTFNNEAKKSAACGFAFDSTACATELTAVQNAYEEYQKALEYGYVDPATGIAEMNNKLMSAGLQVIIDEKQAQLDAWAKTAK